MPIRNPKELFVLMLSDVRQGAERTTAIFQELSQIAQHPDIKEALDNLCRGIRDPVAAKKSRERMDRLREENRRFFGEQNSAVALIRETRDVQ